MNEKFIALDSAIYGYLEPLRSDAGDPLLKELQKETADLGDISMMQIAAEQGTLLRILAGAVRAQNALEIGTFTGYSALCIARGLAPGGKLTCLDQSGEWTDIARRYWERAGVAERIDLRLGDAKETLPLLVDGLDKPIDFVFIDADKPGYDGYYETVLPHCAAGTLLIFDNMLRGGKIATAKPEELDENGAAIAVLNVKLASDPRIEAVLISVADGLFVCRKR